MVMSRVPSGDASSHRRGLGVCHSGGRGSGAPGRGFDNRPNTHGTPATIPMGYQLHDVLDTPETIDSLENPIPEGASRSVTLARKAAAAEVRAANARVEAAAAAEIAATAAAVVAAAVEAQAVTDAEQAAIVAAQTNKDNAIHDEYPDVNKIVVHVVLGRIPRFQPSHSSRMCKIFKLKVDLEGSNWTKVSPQMKEFYWQEFKKHFIWQRRAELAVKECWRKVVGRRNRDFINDRKSDSKIQDYIPPAVWNKWKADWNTPEALELSQKKKRLARMGANGQCSKHTGGSITASEHAIRFEVKNKRKLTCNELFELMYRYKKDKTFVDEKSESINAAFETKKLEISHMFNESAISDDDAIFIELVGGMNKEVSIYGLGSQSSSFHANSTSSGASSSTLPLQVSVSMLREIIEGALTDFGLQNEENVGRRIGKAVESRMGPYERTLLKMQNLLASLTTTLQGQVPNFDDEADDEDLREDDLNED